MNDISLKLDTRTTVGKKVTQLRHEGMIPSIVYGGHEAPLSTQSLEVETTKVVKSASKHTPVHLIIDGKKKLAMIKSVDRDPVKHVVRHVAFHTIKQNEYITAEIPIVLKGSGESIAEKAGLVVLQAIEKIELKALPANLPEALELAINALATTEDKLTIGDIVLPEGTEFADVEQDKDLVIANVYEPSALQAANDAAGGDAEDEGSVEAENGSDRSEVQTETKSKE